MVHFYNTLYESLLFDRSRYAFTLGKNRTPWRREMEFDCIRHERLTFYNQRLTDTNIDYTGQSLIGFILCELSWQLPHPAFQILFHIRLWPTKIDDKQTDITYEELFVIFKYCIGYCVHSMREQPWSLGLS